MFVLFYAEDSEGLFTSAKLFNTHKEAYDKMHYEWLQTVTAYGYSENDLPEDGFCIYEWGASTTDYEDGAVRCEEQWTIVDASDKKE